jgi:hypothetical protein
MNRLLRLLALMTIVAMLALSACGRTTEDEAADEDVTTEDVYEQETAEVKYYCPMKCEEDKTYDEQGTCPVCDMSLVVVEH